MGPMEAPLQAVNLDRNLDTKCYGKSFNISISYFQGKYELTFLFLL